ncbi:MAG TPA: DnaB-like helicase C-terminal domain-containing protein, partial [Candidatus Paceibacterota bacterium]|nr:DnaB-like helicase C-terminal domain-containing protein [Candidatus Paceibacterota bacterium]
PSMGKTSLALDIARNVAVGNSIPTLIFSLEMSAQQLIDRMLAAQAQVDAWKLRTGKLTHEDDFNRIRDSLDVLANAPVFVDDKPGNNIVSMRSTARRLKSEKNLGLIIVDYLQLMVPTQNKNNDNMVQQVTEISRSLKSLARELDVPVIALSQLSRAVEQRGGRPRLSDLRDSGSIEQDADVVMFIHREDKYNENSDKPNIAEIMIEKHRNGPTGRVELYFDDKKTTFRDIDTASHGDGADFADF